MSQSHIVEGARRVQSPGLECRSAGAGLAALFAVVCLLRLLVVTLSLNV